MRLLATCDSNLLFRLGDKPSIKGKITDNALPANIAVLLWFADATNGVVQTETPVDYYNDSTGEYEFIFKRPFDFSPLKGRFSLIAIKQLGETIVINDAYASTGTNAGGFVDVELTDDFSGIARIDDEICRITIENMSSFSRITLTERGLYNSVIADHVFDAQIKKLSAIMTAIPRFDYEVRSKEAK